MTVRKLINALLDKDMDAEVLLFTKDPKSPDVKGVVFHIKEISGSKYWPEILFEDWRDDTDIREVVR